MEQQIFSDGIGRISVIGGIVRLDLVTYSATQIDAQGQPSPILTHRLTMGVEAFLRSSEKILEAAKLISRAQPAPAAPAYAPAPVPVPVAAPAPPPPVPPQSDKSSADPSPWAVSSPTRKPFP